MPQAQHPPSSHNPVIVSGLLFGLIIFFLCSAIIAAVVSERREARSLAEEKARFDGQAQASFDQVQHLFRQGSWLTYNKGTMVQWSGATAKLLITKSYASMHSDGSAIVAIALSAGANPFQVMYRLDKNGHIKNPEGDLIKMSQEGLKRFLQTFGNQDMLRSLDLDRVPA